MWEPNHSDALSLFPAGPDRAEDANRSVKLAVDNDLFYVVNLQKQWTNAVGFLPKAALQRYIHADQCLVARVNGQHAGYINWCCRPDGLLTVPQVAISPELLRSSLGSAIITTLKQAAVHGGCSHLRLKSRSDLDCNQFWPQHGFTPTSVILRPSSRGLPLIEWTCSLLPPGYVQRLLDNPRAMVRDTRPAPAPAPKFVDSGPWNRPRQLPSKPPP